MGIAERKEREKQEMRSRIVQAAEEMILEEGYEEFSIRKLADRIEYSPGTVYLYFKNRDEIMHAIHVEAFRELYHHLHAQMGIAHPVERLRAMGHAYLNFARQNPDKYDLMFVRKSPIKALEHDEKWEAVDDSFGCLLQTVEDAIEDEHFSSKDLYGQTLFIWSTVHGLASLEIRDRLKMFPQDRLLDLQHQVVEQIILALTCCKQ